MIVSKTPLRISFFSGGSDMPSFYEKETGAALSVTINQFIYVCVHKTPNLGVKIMYDQIEEVSDIERMQHLITKEALKYFDINKEITVASISDIVSKGSGLGSSSAFTVGLVNALGTLKYGKTLPDYNATVACDIEMLRCNYPIGKQDQYAAAFGGFNLIEFYSDDRVDVRPVEIKAETLKRLNDNLLLVYSGKGRSANSILQKQKEAMSDKDKFNLVKRSRDKAYSAYKLLEKDNTDDFGSLLHEAWMDKKSVVKEITQTYFDDIYDKALKSGCLGGKLLGAGGGGFFLFYVPREKRAEAVKNITDNTECKIFNFNFYGRGSEIITYD